MDKYENPQKSTDHLPPAAVLPAATCSAHQCEWSTHGPRGRCKNNAAQQVTAPDGKVSWTCEKHLLVARQAGWVDQCKSHPKSDFIEGMGCRACVLGWPEDCEPKPKVSHEDGNKS